MPDVTMVIPFRAGLRGQQLIAVSSDSMLHVFAANGGWVLASCLPGTSPTIKTVIQDVLEIAHERLV